METTNNQNRWDDENPQRFASEENETEYRNFASGRDDEDEDDDEDENQDENDEDLTDWGATDPLDTPGDLPDPMDPSGPGSAV